MWYWVFGDRIGGEFGVEFNLLVQRRHPQQMLVDWRRGTFWRLDGNILDYYYPRRKHGWGIKYITVDKSW